MEKGQGQSGGRVHPEDDARCLGGRRLMEHLFSWRNFRAIAVKELIQMRRDHITFGLMVGIPLIQLVIFGFAINLDPKDLPTALIDADNSAYSRAIVQAVRNTGYFDITAQPRNEEDAQDLLEIGS